MKKFRWTAVLVSFCIFPQKFLLRKSSEVNCLRPRNDSRLKDILNSGRIYVDSRKLVMDNAALVASANSVNLLSGGRGRCPFLSCRISPGERGMLFETSCREARPISIFRIFVSEKCLHLPNSSGTRAAWYIPS